MTTWHKTVLGEVLPLAYGKGLPEGQRNLGPVPVYSSAGQTGSHDTALVDGPCVIVGRKGSVGTVFYESEDCFPIDTAFFTQGSNGIDLRFGYYLLIHSDLKQYSQDSAVPGLNRDRYSSLPVLLPAIDEQRAIAQVLKSLDDKISANTELVRISADLAASAFTEAVRFSADDFILSEVTSLLTRGITPKYSDEQDTVVILNQKCIRGQRVDPDLARRTLRSKVREEKILMMNDVLVNSTGQGTLGRVARWTHKDEVTVDSHVTIVRFDHAKVDPVCAGMALLSLEETITEMGEGSTGQTELSRTELGKLRARLPKRSKQDELGRRLTSMSEMERVHLAENKTLAATRDALLPQLMSGKLRVRDAERVLEKVGV